MYLEGRAHNGGPNSEGISNILIQNKGVRVGVRIRVMIRVRVGVRVRFKIRITVRG
jgi:hypothetical protein